MSLRYIVLDVLRLWPQSDRVMSNHTKPAIAASEVSEPITPQADFRSSKLLREKIDLHVWAMVALAECGSGIETVTRAVEWNGSKVGEYVLELAVTLRREREAK